MNNFEFELWLLEGDRSRHTAIIRDLKRELREEREGLKEGSKRLVRNEQDRPRR
ncbi:hypothetical protein NDA01_24755 [Trichocoleus desertorum AS-A10]|uniref:hypothetical protein n=1 Tax=Trichocoleus desertorum TaxID=1481672 RepID=UPI0032969B7D